MCAVAHIESPLNVDTIRDQLIDLGEERIGIENDSISDCTSHTGMKNSARDLMQNEGFFSDMHGVARICATLISHHPVGTLGDNIDELALPLIAPLCADDYDRASLRI